MNMENDIAKGLKASVRVKLDMLEQGMEKDIAGLARACLESLRAGGKIILAGNGGSAADAQHIAAELVGRYKKERQAIAAVALTTDTSIITALANDYGYKKIFSRQLEAIAKPGDLFFAISTSGESENLIDALKTAEKLGLARSGLLGRGGGAMKGLCDFAIVVPSDDTPRIQEAHITAAHLICEVIESAIGEGR